MLLTHSTLHDSTPQQESLLQGNVLLQTRPHSAWGGAVTAQIYVPIERSQVWDRITDYPRWVQYFPDIIHSEVLKTDGGPRKQLYQVAHKAFLCLTAQVEVYLRVLEIGCKQAKFQLERGSFTDFGAELSLADYAQGTLITYSVQATPTFPVPSLVIQQAMMLDLPTNMKQLRQVICSV